MDAESYQISIFGEFKDRALEAEFHDSDMEENLKSLGPVVLIFGIIFMLFALPDFFVLGESVNFIAILAIRSFVLILSIFLFYYTRTLKSNTNMALLITAYELLIVLGFLYIAFIYNKLTLLLYLSVMAMIVAIYIIPNRIRYAQSLSLILSLFSLILGAGKIDEMNSTLLLSLIGYNLMILIFCNIGAYLTNYYKRRQYVDSKELHRISITDPLTGIYNRLKFSEEITKWTNYSHQNEPSLSLVLLDVDNFKSVNDRFGHLVGDKVLQQITSTISQIIRSTDIFARWGGEEFILLLPRTNEDSALKIVEKIRLALHGSNFLEVGNVTCSFGLVSLKENESAESLINRADKLLYRVKGLGKNAIGHENGV